MELTLKQQEVIEYPLNNTILITGYAGTGKTYALLNKYLNLCQNYKVPPQDMLFIVKDDIKKDMTLLMYNVINPSRKFYQLNIVTISELVKYYLEFSELKLFQNRIDDNRKRSILKQITRNKNIPFSFELLYDEIKFIQENIVLNIDDDFLSILNKEYKQYYLTTRLTPKKQLLSYQEKELIWSIYKEYLIRALDDDIFDESTLYQSFLRLLYQQNNHLTFKFPYIFVDDVEQFTKVQLDIINCFYDTTETHGCYLSQDELKCKDRYKNYQNSDLFKHVTCTMNLDINLRSTLNVYNIIKSFLTNNALLEPKLPYETINREGRLKSVLTFYLNRHEDEKSIVLFDRLDLLVNHYGYELSDILVVFNDEQTLLDMKQACENHGISVIDIKEHYKTLNPTGLTFIHKNEMSNYEFKVVFIYDVDNYKLCTGVVNKMININTNYADSVNFYLQISSARDLLIINASQIEPSSLIHSSQIDYQEFAFELGSKFFVKPTYISSRINDIIGFIKDNLTNYYGYSNKHFNNVQSFDLLVTTNTHSIGVKVVDEPINELKLNTIISSAQDLDYIAIFDANHYLVYDLRDYNINRVIDLPNY